jgi:predicted TIM-barrel fold metal-dependent hydrolase
MIVDAHCHAGPGDGLTGPWDTDAPLGAYLRRARAAGIARTVVFAPFHSDYRQANANTARIVARDPERLIGFAFVSPARDRGRIRALVEEAVLRHGLRGIKAHGIDGRATRELCEAARAFGLPLLYDVVGKPDAIDLLAPQYPDVAFIVPHLGSFADDWRAHRTVIDQIARLPNVYADTSGVRRFDYLVEAVRRAGPGKLIFGTDGPWLHPGLELEKIRLLRLPPADEALVTGGTILRLLERPRAGARSARPAGLR